MKILYICNEYPPMHHGGIGSYTKLIAESLSKKGHKVYVIGNGSQNKSYFETINGVQVYRLKIPKNPLAGRFFNLIWLLVERIIFYWQVKKYAKQLQPDIVETYDWSAPLIFKLNRVKTVIRLHGSNTANNLYMQKNRSFLLTNIEKMAILKADFILSVSNHIAELTKKSFSLNFTSKTIYNGVDTSLFNDYGIERDNNKILFVGRMHPYKGMEDLFAALNFVFAENKSVYFEIICTLIEDYKVKLLSLVSKEFHSRIKFTGRVNNDELPAYYNSANLSILPSRAEAFPIIPLESMSCGTPVIIADRFSAREIVDDNVDGFLVNALDNTELAKKIISILQNQPMIEEMRKKSREKILNNFSIDKVLQDNIDFYQTISGVK